VSSAAPEELSPRTWSQIAAGNVEIHEIPEGHEKILKEPYVWIWADSLKDVKGCLKNSSVVTTHPTPSVLVYTDSVASA